MNVLMSVAAMRQPACIFRHDIWLDAPKSARDAIKNEKGGSERPAKALYFIFLTSRVIPLVSATMLEFVNPARNCLAATNRALLGAIRVQCIYFFKAS